MIKRLQTSLIRRINSRPIETERKRLQLAYPELNRLFHSYVSSFHGDGGFNYAMQDIKVLQLLDLLRNKKAKRVVEYGTGTTSLAMAHYVQTTDNSYLGLDESKKWSTLNFERLESCIGPLPNARIISSDRIDDLGDETYFSNLEYSPTEHFDFMLIDGPSFPLNPTHKNMVNRDILKYMNVGLPETILIDNRRHTAEWLSNKFHNEYTFTPTSVWSLREKVLPTDHFNYFSVLVKK